MDQDLPPVPAPQAAPPVELPWEVEPAPVPQTPRKVSPTLAPRGPEPLHWPMIALTLLTAVTLVFATRADERSRTWEFPSPAGQVR